MTCFFPIPAWKAAKLNPETNKRSLVFHPARSNGEKVEIPCGRCTGCAADRAKDWATRMYNESTLHERNAFLTLTYNDQHLPFDNKLRKSDMQDFIRSLRDRGNKLRYFACGEYGGRFHRPHYHAVIFGMDFLSANSEPCGEGLYVTPEVTDIWAKGAVVCAPVTHRS